MAHEYNRRKNRKERQEQRQVFKDILATVTEGHQPTNNITIEGENISFQSWSKVLQAEAFRSVLSGGFQIHILHNPLVRQIFSITHVSTTAAERRLTRIEKRLFRSKNSFASKERTLSRNEDRVRRENQKQQFLNS